MMRWVVPVLLAITLAGCTDAPAAEPSQGGNAQPASGGPGISLTLTIDVPAAPLEGLVWNATGRVSEPADVRIYVADDDGAIDQVMQTDGEWQFTVALEPGLQTIIVEASRDANVVEQRIEINALAPGRLQVDYGVGSTLPPVDDDIWVNLVDHATAEDYAERGANHPGYANIHDALATWEAAMGHVVEYSYSPGFGSFGVERIDGEGNGLSAGEPPWWCYRLNGERADFGISIQRFVPGDTIAWDLGACN